MSRDFSPLSAAELAKVAETLDTSAVARPGTTPTTASTGASTSEPSAQEQDGSATEQLDANEQQMAEETAVDLGSESAASSTGLPGSVGTTSGIGRSSLDSYASSLMGDAGAAPGPGPGAISAETVFRVNIERDQAELVRSKFTGDMHIDDQGLMWWTDSNASTGETTSGMTTPDGKTIVQVNNVISGVGSHYEDGTRTDTVTDGAGATHVTGTYETHSDDNQPLVSTGIDATDVTKFFEGIVDAVTGGETVVVDAGYVPLTDEGVPFNPPPGWIDPDSLLPEALRTRNIVIGATGRQSGGDTTGNPGEQGGDTGAARGDFTSAVGLGSEESLVGQPVRDTGDGGGRMGPIVGGRTGVDPNTVNPGDVATGGTGIGKYEDMPSTSVQSVEDTASELSEAAGLSGGAGTGDGMTAVGFTGKVLDRTAYAARTTSTSGSAEASTAPTTSADAAGAGTRDAHLRPFNAPAAWSPQLPKTPTSAGSDAGAEHPETGDPAGTSASASPFPPHPESDSDPGSVGESDDDSGPQFGRHGLGHGGPDMHLPGGFELPALGHGGHGGHGAADDDTSDDANDDGGDA